MKGLGTGESRWRRAGVTARRTVVAVATAAIIVGIGSRVNRPVPVPAPPRAERPRVADEVLADVRLDDRSLASLVDSINSAAGRRRVRVEVETLPDEVRMEAGEAPGDGVRRQRLRNVRLGWVLAIAKPYWYGEDLEWREEAGEIVIGGPDTAPRPTDFRLYDVGDLVDGARAWTSRLESVRGQSLYGNNTGPAGEVATMVREVVYPEVWNDPKAGWWVEGLGGWVYVCASEAGHRRVEQFLSLLRRGDSGPVAPAGGGR